MAPKYFRYVPHPKLILLYPICHASSTITNAENEGETNYETVNVVLRLTSVLGLQQKKEKCECPLIAPPLYNSRICLPFLLYIFSAEVCILLSPFYNTVGFDNEIATGI